MKVELSPLVLEASGVFGDLDYYKSRGQQIVRALPSVVPDPSTAQTAVRDAYGRLYKTYLESYSKVKQAWWAYGDREDFPWWSLYVRDNLRAHMDDDPQLLMPGSDLTIEPPVSFHAEPSPPGQIGMTWDPVSVPFGLSCGFLAYRIQQRRITYNAEDDWKDARDGSWSFAATLSYDYQVVLYFYDKLTYKTSYQASDIVS